MKIGFWELVVIVIVAFVFIGPDQLPVYAKKIGKMLRARFAVRAANRSLPCSSSASVGVRRSLRLCCPTYTEKW